MARMVLTTLVASGWLALSASGAAAQPNPSFTYGKQEDVKDVKEVEWSATAEAGVLVSTGNSRTTTLVGTGKASRKDGDNKFEVEATGAYAKSTVRIVVDRDPTGTVGPEDDIIDQRAVSAKNAQLKLRYDRFLTDHDSLYLTAVAGFDQPAGKDFAGGGQAGYSRLLYKSEFQEAKAEVGYDFTYEDLSAVDNPTSIHSLRAFVGYKGALTTEKGDDGKLKALTGVDVSVEGLFNVNPLDVPTGHAGPFEDTRINGNAAITTKLLDDIALNVSFTAKFDNVPAPLALPIPYAPGFLVEAEKLDTLTKATLVVTFL